MCTYSTTHRVGRVSTLYDHLACQRVFLDPHPQLPVPVLRADTIMLSIQWAWPCRPPCSVRWTLYLVGQ